jgi:hypothetical protein
MVRRAALLALLFLAPAWAEEPAQSEDAGSARRREARTLAAGKRWDEAASVFLEVAQARQEGWEAAALDAKACAAHAAQARGETDVARAAFRQVLDQDPSNLLARAGLASLEPRETPKPELPSPPQRAPEPPVAAPVPVSSGDSYRDAEALFESGRLLEARVCLRQCLSRKPGDRAALALSEKISRGLVEQAERGFRRHDRPDPERAPPKEIAFLQRDEEGPRAERAPETDRQANLAQARAKALTLMKSEAFDLAQAALESIRAAHPEARDMIEKDLRDLAQARSRAAARREAEARARSDAEAARSREIAEAKRAAETAHRKEAYEAAEALVASGDLLGAREAFADLAKRAPGYGKTSDYLTAIDKALLERRQSGHESTLATARDHLAQGRFGDARKALTPLDSADPEVAALRTRIAEAEARHAQEAARAQGQAAAQARKTAIEAAVATARQGDLKGARARLYALKAQDPGNPDVPEAMKQVDAIEQAREKKGSEAIPLERRREEAVSHLKKEANQRMLDALSAQAEGLYEGGFLEDARRCLVRVAEDDPGSRDVDRRLSLIDEALRFRAELGTGPGEEPLSTDLRYVQGMALYDLNDLEPASTLLAPLSSAQDLTLWKRQRVARALADIARRRERAGTLLGSTATPP